MKKIIKIILLPVLLVVLLALPAVTGCTGEDNIATDQAGLTQLLEEASTNLTEADSYRMKVNLDTHMETAGSDEDGTMDMGISMEGDIDQKNSRMSVLMGLNMEVDIGDYSETLQDMTVDMYLVDDYLYMNVNIAELGQQWIKTPATEENLNEYDADIVNQQIAVLGSPGELELLRTEEFDGSDCYVVGFTPEMVTIMEWLNEQELIGEEFADGDVNIFAEMIDEFSFTCWIEKGQHRLKKYTLELKITASGESLAELTGETGTLTMNITMTMEITNYGKSVDFDLPSEAQNALEYDF